MENREPFKIFRSFLGQTIIISASGPSLTQEQILRCGYRHRIAISDSWRVGYLPSVLYSCDARWWNHHQPDYHGLKIGLDYSIKSRAVRIMRRGEGTGLSHEPDTLNTGGPGQGNSGYQAINLAYLLGAKRILLLGYDMHCGPNGEKHFFGEHPKEWNDRPRFEFMLASFPQLVQPLKEAGVEVINCTPGSALECFPMMLLDEALQ